MKFLKKYYKNIILSLCFLLGLAVFTYPFYQDAVSKAYDQHLVRQFQKKSARENKKELAALKAEMEKKNAEMKEQNILPADTELLAKEEVVEVEKSVSELEKHMLAVLTIPSLKVEIPVYDQGTDYFLNKGAAHLAGSSLPVGGESTHSVIMAHRGLPEAELFSKLPDMEKGDLFFIDIAGEKLAYEVDQIKTIEPTEIEDLLVVEGQDYVTLMTCTPYMVNSHRYLVRGHRIPYTQKHEVLAAGIGNHKIIVIALTIVGILLGIILGIWLINGKRKKDEKQSV